MLACSSGIEQKCSIRQFITEIESSLMNILGHISTILFFVKSKGIELFNEKLDGLYQIQLKMTFWDGSNLKKRNTDRDPLQHDVVVWHFVSRKRKPYLNRPLKQNIGPVDYPLLRVMMHTIDIRQSKKFNICIHPSTLIQMLQFWVPEHQSLRRLCLIVCSYHLYFNILMLLRRTSQ